MAQGSSAATGVADLLTVACHSRVNMAKIHSDGITVEYNGYLYRTLNSVPVQSLTLVQQDRLMPLPDGWDLAADDPGIISNVVAKYPWGANVLIVNGAAYLTAKYLPAGGKHGTKLTWQGVNCKPASGNSLILIQKKNLKRKACDHCSDLASHLWNERKFTDCTVVCGDRRWQVHRAVLAKSSPVFERMLSVDMLEAKTQEISISICEPDAVEVMLCFAYTGRLDITDVEIAAVLSLADFYQMHSMIPLCADQALKHLTHGAITSVVRSFRALNTNPETKHWWDELVSKLATDTKLLSAALADL